MIDSDLFRYFYLHYFIMLNPPYELFVDKINKTITLIYNKKTFKGKSCKLFCYLDELHYSEQISIEMIGHRAKVTVDLFGFNGGKHWLYLDEVNEIEEKEEIEKEEIEKEEKRLTI